MEISSAEPPSPIGGSSGGGDAASVSSRSVNSYSSSSSSSSPSSVKKEESVSSSAAAVARFDEEEEEEEDVCRICRNPGDAENPLRYPCACSGSIKFVHQDCLLQWLNHSNARQCEVLFQFLPSLFFYIRSSVCSCPSRTHGYIFLLCDYVDAYVHSLIGFWGNFGELL